MATSSQAFATMRALKTQLEDRAGLAGVSIYTAHPGKNLPKRAITMLGFDATQNWAALGRHSRDEEFRISCSVYCELPGASEAVVQDLQDDANAIVSEVEKQLRDDPEINSTVRQSSLVEMEGNQGFDTEGRWCEVTFQIEARSRQRSAP